MAVAKPLFVLDTCILIAAMRSNLGACFRLLQMVGTGRFDIVISLPLALEYEEVGRRQLPFTQLTEARFEAILGYLFQSALYREIHFSWRPTLPDADDDMILEAAVAAGGATIVTFNLADFRGAEKFGVQVCRPQDALGMLGEYP
jgi:predicted nucleic acid-binding protein